MILPQDARLDRAIRDENGDKLGRGPFVESLVRALGSGLIDQSQKMMVAARATAEKKAFGHRS
jgi:hypothetical protein